MVCQRSNKEKRILWKFLNHSLFLGAPDLITVWKDPEFNPKQKAFYYARVIEIPTPRWSTIDAFRFGVPIPEGAPVSTQERAYRRFGTRLNK
jgi:hypothetical protein